MYDPGSSRLFGMIFPINASSSSTGGILPRNLVARNLVARNLMARRGNSGTETRGRTVLCCTLQPQMLEHPLHGKVPKRIFVNSMSDLFHNDVPTSYIKQVFNVMNRASWHQYQVLTKRSDRLLELSDQLKWAPQIWMGVSVESEKYKFRIDDLRKTGAHIKFLSLEALLGPLPKLNLRGIDWAIVGGESGPGARPLAEDWVVELRNQCKKASVPFFFKQWGGVQKKRHGRTLEGRTWDEMPITAELAVT
jgi:protein gp37